MVHPHVFSHIGPDPRCLLLSRAPTGPVAEIDTHTDTHTGAIFSDTGQRIATDTFPATNLGYVSTSKFIAASGFTSVGVEGTSSQGAGLTRYLGAQKHSTVEVLRPTLAVRRRVENQIHWYRSIPSWVADHSLSARDGGSQTDDNDQVVTADSA